MTSINTNIAAQTALRTLQSTNAQLDQTQNRISTGLKIGSAKDNAAYWSISTSLKSDNNALGSVKDALGLGAATVDTAYQGLNQAKDVLDEVKQKLMTASQSGLPRDVIQNQISALLGQLEAVATASNFSGENWLSVDSSSSDYSAQRNVVSGVTRDANGNLAISSIEIDTAGIALYDSNAAGGGLLDGTRDLKVGDKVLGYGGNTLGNQSTGGLVSSDAKAASSATQALGLAFDASTHTAVFNDAGDSVTFTINVDGTGAKSVTIDLQTLIDAGVAATNASSGTLDSLDDWRLAATQALKDAGVTGVKVGVTSEDKLSFTSEKTGPTSSIVIASFDTAEAGSGSALTDTQAGVIADGTGTFTRAAATTAAFNGPITLDADDTIAFTLQLDNDSTKTHRVVLNRNTVDRALGESANGKIDSITEYQKVVDFALTHWIEGGLTSGTTLSTSVGKNLTAASTNASATPPVNAADAANNVTVTIRNNSLVFTSTGTDGLTKDTGVRISDIAVSAGAAGSADKVKLSDIDISDAALISRGVVDESGKLSEAKAREVISAYVNIVDAALKSVTNAAANLGAVASRIDIQQTFVSNLMDTIDKGVSGLVDADMNEESTRLQALQVKQQLGVQALSIANQSAQNVLRLFQ